MQDKLEDIEITSGFMLKRIDTPTTKLAMLSRVTTSVINGKRQLLCVRIFDYTKFEAEFDGKGGYVIWPKIKDTQLQTKG